MVGRKKIYSLGFLVFIIGSILCGLAQDLGFLVGARVVQAVGAAMMMANSFGLITSIFPASERGKALGLTGTAVALGGMTGPALGGVLIGIAGWRLIFFINILIGIIGYIGALLILPDDYQNGEHEGFDLGGAVLFFLGMISLLLAINNGYDWGWSSFPVLCGIILGILFLISFLIIEKKVLYPMIDLSLFRIPPYLIGNIAGCLSFIAMFGNNMIFPFYLQQILNYSPSKVGLVMMAFPIVMAVVAPLSGYASDKFGPLKLTTAGLFVMAISMFYYSTLTVSSGFLDVLPGPLLGGLGSGLFQSPNNSSVMSSVPPTKLGVAGSITSLVRNVGMVIGIAFSVTLFEVRGGVSSPTPEQIPIFLSAYHTVMLAAMFIALVGLFISFSRRSYINNEVQSSNNL